MYSIVKIDGNNLSVVGNGRCIHEIVSMYRNTPEKVSPYNDKLMINVVNIHNFPLKQWNDYYLTITDNCITMYHSVNQYVAPYYKNLIVDVDASIWAQMFNKIRTKYNRTCVVYDLSQKKYEYTNTTNVSFVIPPLPDEVEELIPVYRTYTEPKTPVQSDTDDYESELYNVDINDETAESDDEADDYY